MMPTTSATGSQTRSALIRAHQSPPAEQCDVEGEGNHRNDCGEGEPSKGALDDEPDNRRDLPQRGRTWTYTGHQHVDT